MLVTGDKTFSASDLGIFQQVTAAAALTIPTAAAVDTINMDEIYIFADTDGAVTLVAAEGVTLKAIGTTVTQNGYVTLCKIGTNTWIAYGDLT